MYDIYGEFDTYLEINDKARKLKEAGDKDGVIALAKENGLDIEDAQDFFSGTLEELTTNTLAALGKIAVESADLKMFGVFDDWAAEIIMLSTEDEEFSEAVRRKGKSLAGCFAFLIGEEAEHRKEVDKKIMEKITAKDMPKKLEVSTLNRRQHIDLIRKYYGR